MFVGKNGVSEQSLFLGSLPSELGKLNSLKRLSLEIQDLNGTLPSELGLLTRLTDLRLLENKIEGKHPYTLVSALEKFT